MYMDNRTTIILAVVLVALVAVAGVVLVGGGREPAPTSGTSARTVVPAGMSPEDYVKAYYQAILDEDYAKAFEMQPAASKQGDAASFGTQQKTYGMKSFKLGKTTAQGDKTVVECVQDLGQNGTWVTGWTFVKQGDALVVDSKQTGMQ